MIKNCVATAYIVIEQQAGCSVECHNFKPYISAIHSMLMSRKKFESTYVSHWLGYAIAIIENNNNSFCMAPKEIEG